VSRMQVRRSHEFRGLGCQMMRSALRGILWIAVLGSFSAAAAGAAPTATIFISDGLITPADLAGAFVVTVAFDQTMSETVSPDVVFSPSVSATLTGGVGVWSTSGVFASDRYAVSFTVADADQEAIDVDVTVSGAQSPSPELMQPATLADAFDVDTAAPTVITQDVTVQLDETGNATVTVGQIDNGSLDGFAIASRTLDVTAFTCADVGGNTVTLTVTDVNGNSASDTATVTVEDKIAPTVITQDRTVQLDASGNATITAEQIDNGSSDACGIVSTTLDTTVFTCADVGGNTVTLTVTDVNGNSASDTATVTVEDKIAPTVITQDRTVQLDASGNATITAEQIDNGSSDACGVVSTTLDTTVFTCADVGGNTVTLTVTDVNGNSASDTATVTVEDNVDPVVATQDITVQLDASGNASITPAQIDDGSSDACGIDSMSLDITAFSCADIATNPHTVTLTVTDVNGNSASDTATVTVEDNVLPVITQAALSQTVECDGFGNQIELASWLSGHAGALASDACGIDWTDNFTGLSNGCGETGSAAVTFTATDPSANASTTTATFTITDTTAPTIVWDDQRRLPDTQQMDEDCSITFPISVEVSDVCCIDASNVGYDIQNPGGVSITNTLTVSQVSSQLVLIEGTVTVFDLAGCPRTVSMTVQAADCCGHPSESTDQVTLSDPLAPTIDVILQDADITDDYTCAETLPFTVSIADNCCLDHGSLSVVAEWVSGSAVFEQPTFTCSTTDRTCSIIDGEILAHDLASCAATVRLTVTISDCCGNVYEAVDLGTVRDRCPPHFTLDPPDQATITLPTDAGVGPYIPASNVAVFECDGNYNVSDINAWLAQAAALDSCNPPAVWWPTDVSGFVSGSNLLWNCFSGPCPGCCGATGPYGYTSTGIGTVIFEAEDECGNTITTEDPHDPSWASPRFVIVDTIPPIAVDDPQAGFPYVFAQPAFIEFVEEIDGVLRFVLRENTPIYIDVLSNDVDLCRTGMHILDVTAPSYGTAAIHASVGRLADTCQGQIIRYAPAPNYNGPDEFEYTVRDCSGNTDTAHVDVYVFRRNVAEDVYISAWNGIPQTFRLSATDDMLNRIAGPDRFRYRFALVDPPRMGVIVGSVADVDVEGNRSFVELAYVAADATEGQDVIRWGVVDPFGIRQTAILDVEIEARTDAVAEAIVGVFAKGQSVDIFLPEGIPAIPDDVGIERVGDLGWGMTIGSLSAATVRQVLSPVSSTDDLPRLTLDTGALDGGTYRLTVSAGAMGDSTFVIRIDDEEGER